jgi:acetyltransferase-like isoleucine patch superfamily enzyme
MNLAQYAGQIGRLPYPDLCGHGWRYFEERGCFLDCRGPLVIDATSVWGFRVEVYTRSHNIDGGEVGETVDYPVTVEAGAWIGSHAILAGCKIGAGAIVAAGSVVRGQTVAPRVMVAGNPARVIARWDGKRWVYLAASKCGYERDLA